MTDATDAHDEIVLPRSGSAESRKAAGEIAADYMRGLILDGVLRPGVRIPQDAIADALKLSRLPVREAIITLEREGFITTTRHRGAFVAQFDERVIRENFEIYSLLHTYAIRNAIANQGDALADALEEMVPRLALALSDADQFEKLVMDFHRTVNRAGGSPRLWAIMRSMITIVPGNFFKVVPGSMENSLRGISAIAAAVKTKDTTRAVEAAEAYLKWNTDALIKHLRDTGTLPTTPAPD